MRRRIHAVGRQSDLNQVVVLDMQVFPGGHAHRSVGRQLHDAVVRRADTQLVLGAEHAERLDAADLRPLDFELLLPATGIEYRAHRGAEHLQPGTAVRRPADDLQRLSGADVHRRQVQVVRIGMVRAGQHLGHDDPLQAAADGLDLLEALDLQPDVGQDPGDLPGRKLSRKIAFEPIVRNVHIVEFVD